MEKIDLRKLNNKELFFVRKQVVRLKEKGITGQEILELTGVTPNRASEIWSKYRKEGVAGLKPKTSGVKRGEGTLLTPQQESQIRRAIIDKTPDQMKIGGCLWTRQSISEYIKRAHGVKLSLRCVTNYLQRWGLTCQRPTKRAYAQDDVRVRRFMTEEYPTIKERAQRENADIYWGDETGVGNQENYQRGFAPKGTPPVLAYETKREHVNMISAINNYGSVRFMLYRETMTQQRLIGFLTRLIHDVPRKVFLILDNLRVHHGRLLQKWLGERTEKIEIFFLPPYSPELNPDEYLNHALKRDVHSGKHPRTCDDIIHKVHSFMRRLQHHKDRVRSFFRHPRVAFASLDSYCLVPE